MLPPAAAAWVSVGVWDGEVKDTQGEMGTGREGRHCSGREERLPETAAWQSGDSSFRIEGVSRVSWCGEVKLDED